MPEVTVEIGGRPFTVSCQDGEESFLRAAAAKIDAEAQILKSQIGRIPGERMLLMAGLLLADKTAVIEDKFASLEAENLRLKREIQDLTNRQAEAPKTIEVPVVPTEVKETLAELAARAESVADQLEEKIEKN